MFKSMSDFIKSFSEQAVAWLSTLGFSDALLIFGFVCLCLIPLVLIVVALTSFSKLTRLIQRRAALSAMKKDQTPGNKILIATIDGAGGNTARKQFQKALESNLTDFNFGSPFYMASAPVQLDVTDFALSKGDYETLVRMFEDSQADLIVWGERNGRRDCTRLCFATPKTLSEQNGQGFFYLDLKGHPSDWGEAENLALAYVSGKRLRPALSNPKNFKAERFQPILESMAVLLDAEDVLSGSARIELEDDFAAGALHVGEELNSVDWLTKSVEFRLAALRVLKPADEPLRWSQAKIDLGRAMCLQCEHKFEPGKLQEAMAHIRDGIDNTKSDARMKLAEVGFEALQKAEQMLADRRRFSIRWSV